MARQRAPAQQGILEQRAVLELAAIEVHPACQLDPADRDGAVLGHQQVIDVRRPVAKGDRGARRKIEARDRQGGRAADRLDLAEASLIEADAVPGREIEASHPLGRRQAAGVETIAAQRDLLATGAGDPADRRRLREHAMFEEAVSDDPEIDVPARGTGEVQGDPAAAGIGDLGRHDRGLRQGAVLQLAAILRELDGLSGTAGRPLEGRIRGKGRALHDPSIRRRGIGRKDQADVALPSRPVDRHRNTRPGFDLVETPGLVHG